MSTPLEARQAGRRLVSGLTAALLVAGTVLTAVFARTAGAANPGSVTVDPATDAAAGSVSGGSPATTSPSKPPATLPGGGRSSSATRSPLTVKPPPVLPAPSRHQARASSGSS